MSSFEERGEGASATVAPLAPLATGGEEAMVLLDYLFGLFFANCPADEGPIKRGKALQIGHCPV